jgi:hypothetical protein
MTRGRVGKNRRMNLNKFFSELERRNVYNVAVAYVLVFADGL